MSEPPVLIERRGRIAIVTLNRPTRRNGATVEMCVALYEILQDIAAGDAQVVVLRGAGDDFCVGADLSGGSDDEAGASDSEITATRTDFYHASTLLHTMPQVTIAAIDGGCAGAGMGWAMACDLRLATARARLATAFGKVGASGDMGLGWLLERIVGTGKARELMFVGDKITGSDALAMGLVTRLVDGEALHAEALALAGTIDARDTEAMRSMKANLADAQRLPLADYIEAETARHLAIANRPGFADRLRNARAASKTTDKRADNPD